jgi:hypothetical protein
VNLGFSTGDSEYCSDSDAQYVLVELGNYCFGPLTERESTFAQRYTDTFWHAHSWQLLPRQAFFGPPPGLKVDVGGRLPSPLEIFNWIWTERVQRKIVKESNNYAALKDPSATKVVGVAQWKSRITLRNFCKWCGICAFMVVRSQPSVRDFRNVQTNACTVRMFGLLCPETDFNSFSLAYILF